MSIPDSERKCSPDWRLDQLGVATSRSDAADYLEDFWSGWIAAPMMNHIPHGGWAQLTLACMAVEASALFWKPYAAWTGVHWVRTGKPDLPVQKPAGTRLHDEFHSEAAFGCMFCEVFRGKEPATIALRDLAQVTYKVFRCGLAHRGLSKDCLDSEWLGVIGGQQRVFKDLSGTDQCVLSIDPDKFSECVDSWFQAEVLSRLRNGGAPDIDGAFKSWCGERWNVAETNWDF